jgi:putative ABC transport system ATP-binding protein
MITYNEALAQLCDRVIHIEDGKIIGSSGGTHEK